MVKVLSPLLQSICGGRSKEGNTSAVDVVEFLHKHIEDEEDEDGQAEEMRRSGEFKVELKRLLRERFVGS
jgi:hypothetical protein